MKLRFEKIDDIFSFYKENKTEDEYFIELYGKKYPTNGNYLSLRFFPQESQRALVVG